MEIRYTANTFVAPRRVRFQYRLKGYDKGWRNAAWNERRVFYTNLRPGKYRFQVKACNNHGVWNETGTSFAFSLAPEFTQRPWFPVSLVCGGVLLGAAFLSWRLGWQHRVFSLEREKSLAAERTRIARDLHDDLGTALTGLALELDVIRRDGGQAPPVAPRLAETAGRIRGLAARMREVVWAVNPHCDNVSSLASFLEQQASSFSKAEGLRWQIDFPESIPAMPVDGEARHHLALAVREALTNVVRHAKATEVTLSLAIEGSDLVVRVIDNGRGCLCSCNPENLHGMGNLHARMKRLGGSFLCESAAGQGTRVTFRIPLEEKRPVERRA